MIRYIFLVINICYVALTNSYLHQQCAHPLMKRFFPIHPSHWFRMTLYISSIHSWSRLIFACISLIVFLIILVLCEDDLWVKVCLIWFIQSWTASQQLTHYTMRYNSTGTFWVICDKSNYTTIYCVLGILNNIHLISVYKWWDKWQPVYLSLW